MKIRNEGPGNRVRLTRKVIDSALDQHVRGKRVRLWDAEVRKLFLQITPAGSASYYLRYARADGSPTDYKLCDATVQPEEARRGALNRLAALQLDGVDPVAERRDSIVSAKQEKADTLFSLIRHYDESNPQFPAWSASGHRAG